MHRSCHTTASHERTPSLHRVHLSSGILTHLCTALFLFPSYTHTHTPMLACSDGWGRTDDDQRAEFMGEADRFIHALQEGLKSLIGGLELAACDTPLAECIDLDARA